MTTDFDGFLHMEKVMQNAGTTLDDLKDTYRVWSKTYEKVYMIIVLYYFLENVSTMHNENLANIFHLQAYSFSLSNK